MKVLGIETSCDETAVAVVDGDKTIVVNLIHSQGAEHAPHGGVVPEIAARSHLVHLEGLVREALDTAGAIDAVAATCGPGLIGGVIVGMMMGKAIALAKNIPFVAVNHLEGHALTARLTSDPVFPYLLLLASGGHTQILEVHGVGRYRLLGQTLDDAAGECFDKAAKIMGLGTGGGAGIERLATQATHSGDFALPHPMKGRKGCDFSFSGLKTAVRVLAEKLPMEAATMAPLARAFQDAMAVTIADRCKNALKISGLKTLVASGGVAANGAICTALEALPCTFYAPPIGLCGDNAAMIAWAGIENLRAGCADGMDTPARPRWPLDPHPSTGQ